ncbi:MAG: hypothetical protein H0X62_08990 [Bacteroidetes bacterium]|nr:hypothetical protein [Bacteroidota bacterium]
MKTKNLFLQLLLTSLFIAAPAIISKTAANNETSIVNIQSEGGDVSDDEIKFYLAGYGYQVYSISYNGEGYSRRVITQFNDSYLIVYVEGGKVVGFEDVRF